MEEQIAGEQPVEKATEVNTPETSQEETVTLSKAEAENLINAAEEATKLAEKKSEEYSNLQKWNMKLKKRLEDNGIEEEEPQAITSREDIAQMVKDAIKEVIPQVISPKEEEPLQKANRTIQELKNALISRQNVSPSSLGSNVEVKEVSNNYWTPQQEADLKARGLDPKKVWDNMPKGSTGQGMVK